MSNGAAAKEMVSVRMPAELVTALREHAEGGGESLSDVLRRAALMVLGICPTCERPIEQRSVAREQDDGTPDGMA